MTMRRWWFGFFPHTIEASTSVNYYVYLAKRMVTKVGCVLACECKVLCRWLVQRSTLGLHAHSNTFMFGNEFYCSFEIMDWHFGEAAMPIKEKHLAVLWRLATELYPGLCKKRKNVINYKLQITYFYKM